MYKLESNPLHDTYFSTVNYTRILGLIKAKVNSRSGKNIDVTKQSKFDLFNMMWSVYSVNSFNYSGDIEYQINKMNNIVSDKATDQIISGLLMQQQYMNDIYSLPIPNRLPQSSTQYGKKFGINTGL